MVGCDTGVVKDQRVVRGSGAQAARFHELIDLSGRLYGEACRCYEAECWRGAVLLIGSTVEAALLGTALCFEPVLRRDGHWPCHNADDPTSWPLGQLVALAGRAGWLSPFESGSDDDTIGLGNEVSEVIHLVEEVRDLAAHAAACVRVGAGFGFR